MILAINGDLYCPMVQRAPFVRLGVRLRPKFLRDSWDLELQIRYKWRRLLEGRHYALFSLLGLPLSNTAKDCPERNMGLSRICSVLQQNHSIRIQWWQTNISLLYYMTCINIYIYMNIISIITMLLLSFINIINIIVINYITYKHIMCIYIYTTYIYIRILWFVNSLHSNLVQLRKLYNELYQLASMWVSVPWISQGPVAQDVLRA